MPGAERRELEVLPNGLEWLLLGHPCTQIPDCPRSSRLPDPGQAPAFGFPLIGLHPDQRIDQPLLRGANSNSLDDSACWHSRFGWAGLPRGPR
jgi:hypothetical protein